MSSPTTKNGLFLTFSALAATLALAAGCNEHAPLRENADAQNTALEQARFTELAPAEGTYKGTVKLYSDNNNYDVVIKIHRRRENMGNPSQPTETIRRPQLEAEIEFTALMNVPYEERSQHRALFDPMGWFNPVTVDFGVYTPSTKTLNLPYIVPGYSATTNYGEFSGTLDGRRFCGTWWTKPLGEVGSFDVLKVR
jgi:hypothetical protein